MCSVISDFATMDYSPSGSSVHGILWQEYWRGLPCLSPWDLLNPGIEPESPKSPAFVGRFFSTEPPGKYFKKIKDNGIPGSELCFKRFSRSLGLPWWLRW